MESALEHSGELAAYDEIVTAQVSRSNREAFLRDHEFVDRKYHQYVPLFAARLNEMHGTEHSPRFWQKTLSLALLRHITFCYDMFQACEANLRPDEHECRILSESSFFVPKDFNEHRRFFQHSDFGQEQLFGTYCRLFHPGRFKEYEDTHRWPVTGAASRPGRPRLRDRFARLHPRRAARRLLRIRRPTVAVINSYFSEENMERLLFRSRGRVQPVALPSAPSPDAAHDGLLRESLCHEEPGFDRFDRFVFAALRQAMPKALVENFPPLHAHYEAIVRRLQGVRWIVCEAWIGDAGSALLLAIAEKAGVRHIYNEHNYLAHPFLGNNLKYILPLVDEFATLGWDDGRAPNIVRAASLFRWTEKGRRTKQDKILYVASIPLVRAPEINSSYGESGPVNAPNYLRFARSFLENLSDSTLSEMVFRKYPAAHSSVMQAYGLGRAFESRISRVKRVDDRASSARALMRQARLVIADYISTAYLESMLSDIPTVFFWNRDSYYLESRHADFFDVLVSAGICQTNPLRAAEFVESIKDAPEEWWRSSCVQEARRSFLNTNLGPAENMIEHLLQRCRE